MTEQQIRFGRPFHRSMVLELRWRRVERQRRNVEIPKFIKLTAEAYI